MPLPELEELYTLYRTDLYRYLCHLTHDPTEAEDILSETFLRAMRRLPTYRGDCAVKTWLFGIARNYTYAEIAVQLHISESSARVIEHRTRSWLKEILTKEGYDL